MNDVARSLLPLFFGLTSLTAVACAAPVGAPGEQASFEEAGESADADAVDGDEIASKLSGHAGSNVEVGREALPEADGVMAGTITELVVQPGPSETVYEVLSYSFGIDTAVHLGITGGAHADKSSLVPLSVTVRPVKPGTAPLMSRLVTGVRIDNLVLRQRNANTKLAATTDIAEFGLAFVSSMATGIQNGTMDSYSLAVGKVTVKLPGSKASVGHDVVTNESVGESICGKPTAANLGPYVQADAAWSLPKGSVRIDSASVAISNAFDIGGKAGAGAGKAQLDQIAISGPMEQTGLCAFYYSAHAARVPTVRIDAATSVDKMGALVLEQRWEACGAFSTQVIFTGGTGQVPQQTIALTAEGVVRTDFAGGKAASSFGWSFSENKTIASCSN